MDNVEVSIEVDNFEHLKSTIPEAVNAALEAVGLKAEGNAKKMCPVDTGLLRNSITHAVSGGSAKQSTYHAQYGSGRNKDGKRLSASAKNVGSVGYGSYSGTIGTRDEASVYIGTNVEYAAYVEKGTSGTPPRPFLEPAVVNYRDQYKRLIQATISSFME